MTIFTLSMLIVPVLGPTVGSFLTQAKSWRRIFWLLTILVSPRMPCIVSRSPSGSHKLGNRQSGVCTLFGFVFLQQTFAAAFPERKAARIRKAKSKWVALKNGVEFFPFTDSNLSPQVSPRNSISWCYLYPCWPVYTRLDCPAPHSLDRADRSNHLSWHR